MEIIYLINNTGKVLIFLILNSIYGYKFTFSLTLFSIFKIYKNKVEQFIQNCENHFLILLLMFGSRNLRI